MRGRVKFFVAPHQWLGLGIAEADAWDTNIRLDIRGRRA